MSVTECGVVFRPHLLVAYISIIIIHVVYVTVEGETDESDLVVIFLLGQGVLLPHRIFSDISDTCFAWILKVGSGRACYTIIAQGELRDKLPFIILVKVERLNEDTVWIIL